MKYKHIIFDLDHTLWDFEKNSFLTIKHLFEEYNLELLLGGISLEEYFEVYTLTTKELWKLYDQKKVNKTELRQQRLALVFQHFNSSNPQLEKILEEKYLNMCPYTPHLMHGTLDLLQYLAPKYDLHLLTNGFKSIQDIKVSTTKIKKYFTNIVTSEDSGYSKPNSEAFQFLHDKLNSSKERCLMIGDNATSDILGAHNFGYDSVYFSPENESTHLATYNISDLTELKQLI